MAKIKKCSKFTRVHEVDFLLRDPTDGFDTKTFCAPRTFG